LNQEVKNQSRVWRIDTWFPDLSDGVREKLRTYFDELHKFNSVLNLISARSASDLDLVHISDSILGCQLILEQRPTAPVFDFGSGNGLPGVILGILDPTLSVVLIESDGRKAEFLKHVVARLQLKNVSVRNMRVEDLPPDSVKFAVSRGFASIQKALSITRKILAMDGMYFHFKSESWVREVAEIPSQMCRFWLPTLVGGYSLPHGDTRLFIVGTKKIR